MFARRRIPSSRLPILLALALAVAPACSSDDEGAGSGPASSGVDAASMPTFDIPTPDVSLPDLGLGGGQGADALAEGSADTAAVPDSSAQVGQDGSGASGCAPPTGARPSRRSEHAGVWDPARRKLVAFGGTTAIPVNCGFPTSTFESETWIYEPDCDVWRRVEGAGPPGRTRHMAVLDPTRDRMLVFGGRMRAGDSGPYTLLNDLWAFDLESETWSGVPTTGSAPSARINGAVAVDASRDRMILFGGNTSASGMAYAPMNDLWMLDLATGAWTPVQAANPPSARLFMGTLWDPARQWMVVHGGADAAAFGDTARYFSDLYALDLSGAAPAWRMLDAGGNLAPAGRFWGAIVRDAERDRYVLFGGHDDTNMGNRNDVQAFYPAEETWRTIVPGDTWQKPARGQCDFPPDFTDNVMDSPERRSAHIFSGGPKGAWLAGGKTDCGAVDDVYEFEFATNRWVERSVATVGVSCVRRGGVGCHDLCL